MPTDRAPSPSFERPTRPLRLVTGWAVFAAGASLGLSDAVRWITHHG